MGNEITLTLSEKGAEFIARFEGFRAEPYLCPAGFPTIGYGHVILDGEDYGTVTKAEALELLLADATREAAPVRKALTRQPTHHEADALISLAFNCGGSAIAKSTLVKAFNAGQLVTAGNEFLKWNKAGGKVSNGLTKRRKAEKQLFLTGAYDQSVGSA